MALTTQELLALNDRLAHALERHIEPMFKRGVKVTLLVRVPGNDEADVLVSSEGDLQDVIDMVARSITRNVVGGPGVDRVPRLSTSTAASGVKEPAQAKPVTAAQHVSEHLLAVTDEWMSGWDACLALHFPDGVDTSHGGQA